MSQKKTTTFRKAVDVGQYISQTLFKSLSTTYQKTYPHTTSSFVINKILLQRVLNMSSKAVGIRFMYGLRDRLNPNSISILLVPCSSESEYSQNTTPLISNFGYYDHQGNLNSLNHTTELIANFVRNMMDRDETLEYKWVTRGSFFGKNSIEDFIKNEQCEAVLYNLGLENKIIKPIVQPLDQSRQIFSNTYLDVSQPCPPICGDKANEDGTCFATKSVEQASNTAELDQYRYFRDHVLINEEEGASLYEMYYFISPLITSIINRNGNSEQIFEALYLEKIAPFKRLIDQGETTEAIRFLKETFNQLANTYQVDFVEQ